MSLINVNIRLGAHELFTLELTVRDQPPVIINGFLTVEDAQLKAAELIVKAPKINLTKIVSKPIKYRTHKTPYGTIEIWLRSQGKEKYVKSVKSMAEANLFIKGQDIVEQSMMNDLKNENAQLNNEVTRLRNELDKAHSQIPNKGVTTGDLLPETICGNCPKCHEPFAKRYNPDGVPFKGCSQYHSTKCKGRASFTEHECRTLHFDESDTQKVIADQQQFKKSSPKKTSNKPEWDLSDISVKPKPVRQFVKYEL